MPYEQLLEEGRVRRSRFRPSEIWALLDGAGDQALSSRVHDVPREIRHNLAYDAARSAAQAVMYAEGFRAAAGPGQHEAVFKFLAEVDDGRWQDEAGYFDISREKRNRSEYGSYGQITESEAAELAAVAERFLSEVRTWLAERGMVEPDEPTDSAASTDPTHSP